jgi:hypothetical protein
VASNTDTLDFGGPIVWRPTEQHIRNSNLKRFMDRHGIGSYDELMRRSTDDFAWFWDDILRNEFKIRTTRSSICRAETRCRDGASAAR